MVKYLIVNYPGAQKLGVVLLYKLSDAFKLNFVPTSEITFKGNTTKSHLKFDKAVT